MSPWVHKTPLAWRSARERHAPLTELALLHRLEVGLARAEVAVVSRHAVSKVLGSLCTGVERLQKQKVGRFECCRSRGLSLTDLEHPSSFPAVLFPLKIYDVVIRGSRRTSRVNSASSCHGCSPWEGPASRQRGGPAA